MGWCQGRYAVPIWLQPVWVRRVAMRGADIDHRHGTPCDRSRAVTDLSRLALTQQEASKPCPPPAKPSSPRSTRGSRRYGTGRVRIGGAVPQGFGGGGSVRYQPSRPVNFQADPDRANIEIALDQLQAAAPDIESVSLVVAWFGTDLRAGDCRIEPRQEADDAWTSRPWRVGGLDRFTAPLVSRRNGVVSHGGAIDDAAVIEAIAACKARGLRVTFYPFLLMDIPEGNDLPNPWSDHAAAPGQPVFPWRGRITCSPAPGVAGSVDTTPEAGAQVAAFFGAAQPGHFTVATNVAWPAPWGAGTSWGGWGSGTGSFARPWPGINGRGGADPIRIAYTGPASDWGLRRMILHYATLCDAAGGVDAFLIGSELRGLTTIRDGAASYPAVQAFRTLAADVRSIVGAGTKISYAADWSEYFGHHPADGSGDVFFHLDPLWSDPEIDFVGIDNYMPLSDWRDGFEHADAQEAPSIYDRAYLQANIEGGEGFDWVYASGADRAAQVRTPITDGAYDKPWVFRYKDLRSWWSQPHFDRPGGVESATPTPWVPRSKPIWFTEFGCPAVDRGTNQPNVFFDPKSSESFVPHFSRGWRDDAIQRAYIEATLLYWADPANNPLSPLYGGRMVDLGEAAAWTWDARPYPQFPGLADVWDDGPNWERGHWLTGRLGSVSLAALVRHLCRRAGLADNAIDVSGLWGAVEGYTIAALEPPRESLATLARHFGFDGTESGGRLRFVMRGRAPAAVLRTDANAPPGALVPVVSAGPGTGGGEPVTRTREQESEIVAALKWQFTRADADYDYATAEAQRIAGQALGVVQETFPLAVAPQIADARLRRALLSAWLGREQASVILPPSTLALDPGDVLTLDDGTHTVDYRIARISDAQARAVELVRQDREIHDLPPGAPRDPRLRRTESPGAPDALVLDLPILFADAAPPRLVIAAHADPWPGVMELWRAPAPGLDFERAGSFARRARTGVLGTDLAPGPIGRRDRASVLEVALFAGALDSVTEFALLGGANTLAIETAPGAWEIVQAQEAALIAPRVYRLTRLLRGQRGSEWAIADPAPAGARVVVLEPGLGRLPLSVDALGLETRLAIAPAGAGPNADSAVHIAHTPAGRGLIPFAPVHLRARRLGGGDIALSWIRRDRALEADSWVPAEIPMSEATEAYRVQIRDGATLLRSVETTAPHALYTAAAQIADWGAPLPPGAALTLRIQQRSAVTGPGDAASATFSL